MSGGKKEGKAHCVSQVFRASFLIFFEFIIFHEYDKIDSFFFV